MSNQSETVISHQLEERMARLEEEVAQLKELKRQVGVISNQSGKVIGEPLAETRKAFARRINRSYSHVKQLRDLPVDNLGRVRVGPALRMLRLG